MLPLCSQDRSGPGAVPGARSDEAGYAICCVTICCLCVHRIELGQVLFLVHGLMELVTLCVVYQYAASMFTG